MCGLTESPARRRFVLWDLANLGIAGRADRAPSLTDAAQAQFRWCRRQGNPIGGTSSCLTRADNPVAVNAKAACWMALPIQQRRGRRPTAYGIESGIMISPPTSTRPAWAAER
jgi:hypothetical protein